MNERVVSKILESQKICKKQKEVYSVIAYNGSLTGPLNGLEIKKICNRLHDGSETVRSRITELKKMGLVEVVGKEKCKETGRLVALFQITDRDVPVTLDKRSAYSKMKQEHKTLKMAVKEVIKNGKITEYFNDLVRSIRL